MKRFIFLGLVALFAAGCGNDDNLSSGKESPGSAGPDRSQEESAMPESESESVPAALVGEWTLVEVAGATLPEGIRAPTLTVMADGTVGGNSGVNRFTGRLADRDDALFGPMASTRMAGPPAAMELENRVLNAMTAATSFEVEGDRLILSGPGGPLLTFGR
jgi:heat shock protein HslJ